MKRERVIQAIRHQQTDIIPFNTELTSEELRKVCDYLNINEADWFDWSGNHIDKLTLGKPDINLGNQLYEDEFGVIWSRSIDKDIGIIENPILSDANIGSYQFPEINRDFLDDKLMQFTSNGKDCFRFAKINFSLFERAWSLRGFENMFMDFVLNPDFVTDLLEKITLRNIEVIKIALQYDIDGIYLGDDYGQQNGMLMSPDMWRKFFKPQLGRMISEVKKAGKISCLHSCGNIKPILPDLIDIGLDVYQTVQPEIYDLNELKQNFGKNLTFFGGISTQQSLPVLNPNEIRDITSETMRIFGKNGGYIAAPTHKVPADVSPENLVAMVETFKSQIIN